LSVGNWDTDRASIGSIKPMRALGGKLGVGWSSSFNKLGVSLILVQGNEYLSKLSLLAISTLVAGRLHTADSGSPGIFFFLFKCAKCAPGHLIQHQKRRWYYSCGVKPKMRGQAGRVYWVVFDFWTRMNR
jgi:hypothetical protein